MGKFKNLAESERALRAANVTLRCQQRDLKEKYRKLALDNRLLRIQREYCKTFLQREGYDVALIIRAAGDRARLGSDCGDADRKHSDNETAAG